MNGRWWIADPLGHRRCERDGTAPRHPVLLVLEDDGSVTTYADPSPALQAHLQAAFGPEVGTVTATPPADAWYCDRCNQDVPITDGRGHPSPVPVIDGDALCPACFPRLGVPAAEWGGCCPCPACRAGRPGGPA